MPLLKATAGRLDTLDLEKLNSRTLVVSMACLLADVLRKHDVEYVASLRHTQAKAVVANLPALAKRLLAAKRDLVHEVYKVMRAGPDQYLKQATRELSSLLTGRP